MVSSDLSKFCICGGKREVLRHSNSHSSGHEELIGIQQKQLEVRICNEPFPQYNYQLQLQSMMSLSLYITIWYLLYLSWISLGVKVIFPRDKTGSQTCSFNLGGGT